MTDKNKPQTYLGDGVYAEFDGYQVWVWTEDGPFGSVKKIALEPDVLQGLVGFYQKCLADIQKPA